METKKLPTNKEIKTDIKLQIKKLEESVMDNDPALTGKLIGKLNQVFYGMNLTELREYFVENHIALNGKSIKDNFNYTHLMMQRALIIKLRKEIEEQQPTTIRRHYALAVRSGKLAKDYFIKEFREDPLENLRKAQYEQIDINKVVINGNALTPSNITLTKESKNITTKTLHKEIKDSRIKALKELEEAKKQLLEESSHLGSIKRPEGFVYSLCEELITKVYNTKDVKTIKDITNKLSKQLNIEITSLEDIMPTKDIEKITYAINKLAYYIATKNGRETRKTISSIYDYTTSLSTMVKDTMNNETKRQNPKAKVVSPYIELKKHVRTLK